MIKWICLSEDPTIKIISCTITVKEGLEFSKINLQEVGLFVGQSGSGKTRLLNSIFNVATFAIGRGGILLASWEIVVEHENKRFYWEYNAEDVKGRGKIITKEIIKFSNKNTKHIEVLVDRTSDMFTFKGNELPKLPPSSSSIYLLKEEELIKPLYDGWSKLIRRNFSGNELMTASSYSNIPAEVERLFKTEKNKGLYELFNYNLNLRLFLIEKYDKEKYEEIIDKFKAIFPFVIDCKMSDATKIGLSDMQIGFTPVFVIKELGIQKELPLHELASGMIKVLLILTDVLTLPDGAIYLMDEYENSLGVNAIDFLPGLLLEHKNNKQFLITSHHPYLINQMPVSNWYVLSRKGLKVDIKYGEELVKRYGKSTQQAFTQLINDPFYNPENK